MALTEKQLMSLERVIQSKKGAMTTALKGKLPIPEFEPFVCAIRFHNKRTIKLLGEICGEVIDESSCWWGYYDGRLYLRYTCPKCKNISSVYDLPNEVTILEVEQVLKQESIDIEN